MKPITVNIEKAAEHLLLGQPVAIPTETVYGLAAVYDNHASVKRVYDLKKRPLDHPLILHLNNCDQLQQFCTDIPNYVPNLLEEFAPGPLTLVLKKSALVPEYITGGQDTVAVRIPNHTLTRNLINRLGKPIVAPSANPYCQISPTTAAHVFSYFKHDVPILDGGACDIGIESTILLATNPSKTTLLRPGAISAKDIAAITGLPCENDINAQDIQFPGNKKRHYAPQSKLILIDEIETIKKFVREKNQKYCFILLDDIEVNHHEKYLLSLDPKAYSREIYRLLHQIDLKFDMIITQNPPNHPEWDAILDRLSKASFETLN